MKRFIDTYLDEWTEKTNRKPLILRGARQVGKTYTVLQLAKRKFKYLINLNFERHRDLIQVFETNDLKLIIAELSAYFSVPVNPGETLIFFDEVQTAPPVLGSLRYFYEEMPSLHVIAAGSLLDHLLNDLKYPMPVGRVEFAYMYPMTFSEFLLALDENGLVQYFKNYTLDKKFSLPIHRKALSLLRFYYFIGGMPEAVRVYAETGDLTQVEQVHESILTSLQYDFSKYGTLKEQQALSDVLNYAARGIGKKVKYTNINPDENHKTLKSALLKLELSRIVHLVRKTKFADVPINQYVDHSAFKPLFMDIGLANHLSGIRLIDIKDLITDYEGALAEQFVGQQLIASLNPPYIDTKLYYWQREAKNSNAELDYLLQIGNQILPVEVKAGKTGTLKSLHVFLAHYKKRFSLRFNVELPNFGRNLQATVRFTDKQIITYDLLSLPLYLAEYLAEIVSKAI